MKIEIATLKNFFALSKLVNQTDGLDANAIAQAAALVVADGDIAAALDLLMTKTTEDEDDMPDSILSRLVAAMDEIDPDLYLQYEYTSPAVRRARRAALRAENKATRARWEAENRAYREERDAVRRV